jgi:hypothetical protein
VALHIQDEEADRLLREFARRRGIGLTAAVKVAVKEASAIADSMTPHRTGTLAERIAPLQAEVREAMRRKATTPEDLKQFMDEGWDDL